VNREINTASPDIKDIAPTVLKLFGVDIPKYMKGKPLIETAKEGKWEKEKGVKVKAG